MKLYNVYVESAICREEFLFVDLDDALSFIEQEHETNEKAEIWIATLDTDRKMSYGQVYVETNERIY